VPTIPLNLGTRSNPTWHNLRGAARLVNCYSVKNGPEAVSEWGMRAVDGERVFSASSSTGGVRALLELDGTLYGVIGRLFFSIDAAGTRTQISGIPTDGLVTMERNRRAVNPQIAIASQGLLYIYSNGTLEQVTDGDLLPANAVTVLDGYAITTVADGRWQISAIDNATTWDGLDVATAESQPDGLLRPAVRGQDLALFGPRSIEWYQNTGAEFPFARTTAIRDLGLMAAGTVASLDQQLAFVGSDGTVRRTNGYGTEVVSDDWLHELIHAETDKSALSGLAWVQRGQWFYALTGANFTAVLNARTGMWHERRSYELPRWRMSAVATFGERTIVGDYENGTLYELSGTAYDEAGQPLLMEVITPCAHLYPARMRADEVFVNVVPGVGLATGGAHEINPTISLSTSEDRGHVFSAEDACEIGRQGDRIARVRWQRLGSTGEDGYTFRLRMSAAHVKGIDGAALTATRLAP